MSKGVVAMRKVFLIGLVGLVSLAIVQPALAQRGGRGGFHGGGGGGFHRGGGGGFHHHARTSFSFGFFLPLFPWYYAPYPYYSYPSYPYNYYPAPPAYSYVPPAPDVGYVHLEVEPRDAHVYVNGQYLGPVQQFAGGAATLAPGSYQVAVVAWGYRPFQQEVQIVVGQTATMRVTLERDPAAPVPPPSLSPGTY
ncbi:MAG: PEGA domain-containing protein [Candidatus Rokubacteria bacterium]|nr:PEGA domain-containing protein [Candidatus Rokubacteria bacterium]